MQIDTITTANNQLHCKQEQQCPLCIEQDKEKIHNNKTGMVALLL